MAASGKARGPGPIYSSISLDYPFVMPANRRAVLWASLVLVLIGVADGAYLTRLHYKVHTDPAYRPACNVNETFNCGDIALSEYAVFAGVPVAVWTLLGNGVLLFLLVWALRLPPPAPDDPKRKRRAPPAWPSGLYFLVNAAGLAVTATMFWIAEFVLGLLCVGCAVMYAVNPAIFAGSVWLLKQDPGALGRDLRGWRRHAPLPRLALATAAVAGALIAFYPRYWNQPFQNDKCDGLPTGVAGDGTCWVGAQQPKVEITEFSDYECPFCRTAHARLRELVKKHPDRLRLVHKHFPLDTSCNPMMQRQLHPSACRMARMAYCASLQGKFWAMNDKLFNTPKNTTIDPAAYAAELSLDVHRFSACIDSAEAVAHVRKDVEEGLRLKIEGTPTFFLDDTASGTDDTRKPYVGEVPEAVIESLLK